MERNNSIADNLWVREIDQARDGEPKDRTQIELKSRS